MILSVAKLNEQLCFALYSASSHLTGVYRKLLDPLDLTYPQFIVLMALWEKDGISISELATKTALGKATMTPLLKRLEGKKLIERHIEENNERQKRVILTEQGRQLSSKSADITEQVFCATGLTKTQAYEMITTCQKITQQSKA